MVYFDDNEVKVLIDMIDYCDACDEDSDSHIPRAYSELLGVLRYKLESERLEREAEKKKSKGGVAE